MVFNNMKTTVKKDTNLKEKVIEEIVFFLESSLYMLSSLVINENQIRFFKDTNTNMYKYDIVNMTENFYSITIQEVIVDKTKEKRIQYKPILVEGLIPLNRLEKTFQKYYLKF